MTARQAVPRLWLLTDERQGEALWDALARLPCGSGVLFRHYRLAPAARCALYQRVRGIARQRRLILVLAGTVRQALAWRADGAYGPALDRRAPRRLLRLAPAHGVAELVAAARDDADAALLSPVYPTRSHPVGRTLGRVRFGLAARGARLPVIALGGMNATGYRALRGINCQGWAGIDAFGAAVRT